MVGKYHYISLQIILLIVIILGVSSSAQVISPLYSTYLGGSSKEGSYEVPILIDNDGYVYVAARTKSPTDYPYVETSYDTTYNGGISDIVISKFTPDLSTLVASTYFGGSNIDANWPGVSMAIDQDGNIFVTANTYSTDLPTDPVLSYQPNRSAGYDAFIAKFDSNLENLLACTYLGGTGNEYYLKILVDESGDVYIVGTTSSYSFPGTDVAGIYDSSYAGGAGGPYPGDIFISKLSGDLSTLYASTYLGHSGNDYSEEVMFDADGNIVLTGWTSSGQFPFTEGAYDSTFAGGYYDGFVSIVSPDLTTLVASTLFGGTDWDFGYGMTIDDNGDIYVTGHTRSRLDFPITDGVYDSTYNGYGTGSDDVFISKFNSSLTELLASTFLGGTWWEIGLQLKVDPNAGLYVVGVTNSSDFPMPVNVWDDTYHDGEGDYEEEIYITLFSTDLDSMLASTFLGGSGNEVSNGITLDADHNLYLAGCTNSTDFPLSSDPYDSDFNGEGSIWDGEDKGGDLFVTALSSWIFYDNDSDGLVNPRDNCPDTPNQSQDDVDLDGVGDLCDNCPEMSNPDQIDNNDNGIGDACEYICGDINDDGNVNILDITTLIAFLYQGGSDPNHPESADVNSDSNTNILDITYLISFLYQGGQDPQC